MNIRAFTLCAVILLGRAGIGSAADTNGWAPWSPRAEIAPRFAIEPKAGRDHGPALSLKTADTTQFGAWKKTFTGIHGGQNYRFAAWYRADNVPDQRRSVIARLQWLDQKLQAARPPDYALDA